MKRRLYRSILVGYFCLVLLCVSACNMVAEYEPDEIIEVEEIVIEEPDNVDIETDDIPIVASSMHEIEEIVETTEEIEEVEPESPIIDISNDGFISEDSLYNIASYVGSMYDIDPLWLMAVAKTESNYDVFAVGSSNDCGLCQIIPKWSKDRIEKLGITDIFDPVQNITLCADILNEYRKDTYGYDRRYVSMAYNMGRAKAKKLFEAGTISNYAERIEKNYDILKETL